MTDAIVSLKTKQTALNMVQSGNTKANVARHFNVSPRTIGRWIDSISNSKVSADVVVVDELEEETVEENVSATEYKVIITKRSISISEITAGQCTGSIVVDSTNEIFDNIRSMLVSSGLSDEAIKTAYVLAQPKRMIEHYTEGKLFIDVKNDKILFKPSAGVEYPISGTMTRRIIDTIKTKGYDGAKVLINFASKLMENPSNKAVNELYGFLIHNDIELADDGCFYAWKKVKNNYKDKYTGKINNSPGLVVKMERNQVNERSEDTCSSGLHACAKSYLPNYSAGGDCRIVKVKIHPKDVVSIPTDYNNAKMRVCEYFVESDVTDLFSSKYR